VAEDWGVTIRRIARGWLFGDVTPERFPASAILPLENPDGHEAAHFLDGLTAIETYRAVTFGERRGRRIALLSSKFGAPATAMTVEVLADLGVQHLVGVGFCGGFAPDVQCGDFVLPSVSLRDDGTTARYVAPDYVATADAGGLARLREMAKAAGVGVHVGPVWSTDTVMLETSENILKWAGASAIAIDMECGALFTLAALRGIRAVAVLVASDHPIAGRETDLTALGAGHARAARLALDYLATV
jgi:uridine phosphorylase